ncbi:hypothetical protein [Streptomyces sp. NPDC096339]|uniref:hypothetical protein n=1 Tax=Streptomyces sp. NPDC096339 TaxID=3366086 RepID=UPI0037F90B2A
MSPTPADRGPTRSLAEIDAAIRVVVLAGRAGSEEYAALLVERAESLRIEVQQAA